MGEHCYNTNHHMSIGMSPLKDLYGNDAFSFVDLIFDDNRVPKPRDLVAQSQDILSTLKDNIQRAQN